MDSVWSGNKSILLFIEKYKNRFKWNTCIWECFCAWKQCQNSIFMRFNKWNIKIFIIFISILIKVVLVIFGIVWYNKKNEKKLCIFMHKYSQGKSRHILPFDLVQQTYLSDDLQALAAKETTFGRNRQHAWRNFRIHRRRRTDTVKESENWLCQCRN